MDLTPRTAPPGWPTLLLAVEEVGEPAPDQQELPVTQHIRRHDPLQGLGRHVEVALNLRQRGADGGDVIGVDELDRAEDHRQ